MSSHGPRRETRVPMALRPTVLLLLSLTLVSCDFADPFAEYRSEDILTSRGMTLAMWGPGYLPGTMPTNGFPYISLEVLAPAEYGTAQGLPDGADVYRLELLNLLPDGDFERAVPDAGNRPPFWELVENPTPFYVAHDDNPGFGTGNYLDFTVSTGALGRIDLGEHLKDELVGGGIYHIQFETIRRSTTAYLAFDYGDEPPETSDRVSYLEVDNLEWEFDTEGKPDTPKERFPGTGLFERPGTFYASDSGTGFFYVGSPRIGVRASSGYLDNVRIGRVDILPHWALILSSDTETGLPLVPGRYRFRIFVKSEIDSQVTPSPDGLNRFRSKQISIGANNSFVTISAAEAEWNAGRWVEVIREFELSPADVTRSPALAIQITPSSIDTPAVGSILISSPVLELVF